MTSRAPLIALAVCRAAQQRNVAYLRYARAAGHRPRLAELLAAPSSPPGTSPPEAASLPADRYRDILARILSGLLPPTTGLQARTRRTRAAERSRSGRPAVSIG